MSRGSIFSFHKVPRVLYKLHNSFAMTKGVQCIFVPKQFSYPFIIVIAEKNGREERARKEWRLRPTGSTRPFYYVGRISIRTIYPGWDRVSQGRKDDRSRRRNIGSVPRRYAIGSSVRIKNNNNLCEIFDTFIPGNPIDNLATLRAKASNLFNPMQYISYSKGTISVKISDCSRLPVFIIIFPSLSDHV